MQISIVNNVSNFISIKIYTDYQNTSIHLHQAKMKISTHHLPLLCIVRCGCLEVKRRVVVAALGSYERGVQQDRGIAGLGKKT